MARRVSTFFFLGGLFLGAAQASASSIVYSQPSSFPNGFGYTSQDFGVFGISTAYDNFILSGDALITDVHWQGEFFAGAPASISAFTIAFSADAAGQPGAAILSQTVPGNAGEAFVGSVSGFEVFNYSLVLPTSFFATAGTQYWLSIVAVVDDFPPLWAWHTAVVQDNVSFQDFLANPRAQLTADLAFDLTGDPATAVPEPVSLTLVGSGVVAVIGRRFRRRRESNR